MIRKKVEYHFRKSIEVEEYVDGRFGAKGKKRKEKVKATPEQVEKQNRLNKSKRIRRRIKNNFSEGDYYLTLTFKKENRPESVKDAIKIWGKVQRKLRDVCKKQNKAFKWIACIERGGKGAIHFHLIMNRLEEGDRILQKIWTYGRVHMQLLYEEGGFRDSADYISKTPNDKENGWYSHSRNLPIPKPRVKRITSKIKEPKAYKGYYIDKNTIYEGINPVTGYLYRHYEMIKLDRRI